MARPPEIPRRGGRAAEHIARDAAIVRADARADGGVRGVDGDGVGGAVGVGVGGGGDHGREVEEGGAGGGEGRAEVARGVPDEEGGFGGAEVSGGYDQVAFVFAGGGVEDDEEVAGGCWGGREVLVMRI